MFVLNCIFPFLQSVKIRKTAQKHKQNKTTAFSSNIILTGAGQKERREKENMEGGQEGNVTGD